MNTCLQCGVKFGNWIMIDGKSRNLCSRKYCLSCSPFGNHNTRRLGLSSKLSKKCLQCGKKLRRQQYKYCSSRCQRDDMYVTYIDRWKQGLVSGATSAFLASKHVGRYLREKYGDKCARCGWHEINSITNRAPLEIDHIDGNHRNNSEDNLILLCPNCHALTPTYRGLNRGKGRRYRIKK